MQVESQVTLLKHLNMTSSTHSDYLLWLLQLSTWMSLEDPDLRSIESLVSHDIVIHDWSPAVLVRPLCKIVPSLVAVSRVPVLSDTHIQLLLKIDIVKHLLIVIEHPIC